jgi:RimJ/RimL family protein N-acetyltransferase
MPTTYTIRRLDQGHAEAWAALRREALEAHPLAFGASIPEDPGSLVELIRARLASDEESCVFGAFAGTSLVGIVGIRRDTGKKERHKSLIWGMFVSPTHRRSGVGAALLQMAIAHARTWPGVEQVQLAVSEVAEDARRLYERNGFQSWGREPRALCWEGRSVDETHMILDLREPGLRGRTL